MCDSPQMPVFPALLPLGIAPQFPTLSDPSLFCKPAHHLYFSCLYSQQCFCWAQLCSSRCPSPDTVAVTEEMPYKHGRFPSRFNLSSLSGVFLIEISPSENADYRNIPAAWGGGGHPHITLVLLMVGGGI